MLNRFMTGFNSFSSIQARFLYNSRDSRRGGTGEISSHYLVGLTVNLPKPCRTECGGGFGGIHHLFSAESSLQTVACRRRVGRSAGHGISC